ncbi:hypothetical protein FRX31_026437 [Thalictrum thalictroides]|uniref:Uncharacterized protein n=1 Tax=Thalictrum thalictroides TaxID=46969 RepID=A0A7J6VH97_THATH|nr:hypothetical protein FRX31_026437 [Thalictrum thalictroides]
MSARHIEDHEQTEGMGNRAGIYMCSMLARRRGASVLSLFLFKKCVEYRTLLLGGTTDNSTLHAARTGMG